MKSWALALAALLAVVIGWLAWRSKAADAPPVIAQAPAASTPGPRKEEVFHAPCSESSRASPAPAAKDPVVASPATQAPLPVESAAILLRGAVRDEQGNPVASAHLGWTDDRGLVTYSGVTDGSYSTAGLHPGHMLLEISGWGRRTEQFDLELAT